MQFTTEDGVTYQVRAATPTTQEIRESPDFFAIGPLDQHNTFRPFTFSESPTMDKPCVFNFQPDEEGTIMTITTAPVVHIQF